MFITIYCCPKKSETTKGHTNGNDAKNQSNMTKAAQ